MSKKNETKGTVTEQSESCLVTIDKLLANGTLTLTADSREKIYEQSNALVAAIPNGTKWTRGIVEHNAGIFKQTYFIIKD